MATAISTSPLDQAAQRRVIPLLVNGDRLTREEFERRYKAMPKANKAELIEGVVYMPSPVRYESHSKPHMILAGWMTYYVGKTPGLTGFGDNGTIRLDNDNEPQSDLFLLLPQHAGGKSKVDDDDYISGPPALVCEVAASSVSIDSNQKKTVYRRNGVQEYIIWRAEDSALDWFVLERGDYTASPIEADGTIRSRSFPGLWLNPRSLIAGDLQGIFALLDQGTATPEHGEFVKRLAGTGV